MFVHNSSTQLQSKALLHNPLLTIFTFLVSLQMQNLDTCGVVYIRLFDCTSTLTFSEIPLV